MVGKYLEIVENKIAHRGNIFGFDKANQLLSKTRDFPSWTSMFLFDEEILTHIEDLKKIGEQPSTAGFKGKCFFMNYLWIDIDTKTETSDTRENLKSVIKETKQILNDIMLNYDLQENNFRVFYSGNKGFHIGIPSALFGGDKFGSEAIPTIAKIMAKELTNRSSIVDFKIYNTNRLFRTPFSKHDKTGLYKVIVSVETILNQDVDKILTSAETCVNEPVIVESSIVNYKLKELFDKCCGKSGKEFDLLETVKEEHNVVSKNKTLFRVPHKNERNDSLFRMGLRLFGIPKEFLKTDEVVDIIRMVVDTCNHMALMSGIDQLTDFEVRTLINQAFKYTRLKSTTNAIEASNVTDFAMRVLNYAKYSRYVSTLVDDFDEDLGGGGVVGNLYSIIGKGGTMKSIWLQNMAIRAAIDKDISGIYFNQEMSENVFFDRTCRIVSELFFIKMVKEGTINEDDIPQIVADIDRITKKKIILVNQNNLSPNDIDDIFKRKEDELGESLFYGMVDSASGMLQVKDEVTSAVHNSKELKEVAKRRQKALFLINHCNAQAPDTARDVSQWIRGGTKTVDNGDGYFSLSKCVNMQESSFEYKDIKYLPGVVYIRFVNKRESGNTIDKIIQIGDNLRANVLSDDPKSFNFYAK